MRLTKFPVERPACRSGPHQNTGCARKRNIKKSIPLWIPYAGEVGFDAVLIAAVDGQANTDHDSENVMNDLLFVAIFLACCMATWLLAELCNRLMPHDTRQNGGQP
jgi:hypothetical protein